MAQRHTYFLAAQDRICGDAALSESLGPLLREIWSARGANEDERTPVDGVSAWLDAKNGPQIRVVARAHADTVTDAPWLERVAATFTAP